MESNKKLENLRQTNIELSELINLAKSLFEHIEGQIKSADSKAWLTLSANGILATLFTALSSELFKIQTLNKGLSITVVILLFGLILGSIFYAFMAVKPSLIGNHTKNLFYFGTIQKLSVDDFIQDFRSQTQDEVVSALLAEVHIKSKIANRKFNTLVKSVYLFFCALVLGAIVQIVVNLSR